MRANTPVLTINKSAKAFLIKNKIFKMTLTANYVTGLIEADGSFQVGFERDTGRKNFCYRPDVRLTFTQSSDNEDQVNALKEFFGVGKVSKRDNRVDFVVQTHKDLREVIIPHFRKYPLIGDKIQSFIIFERVLELLNQKPRQKAFCYLSLVAAMFEIPSNRGSSIEDWIERITRAFPEETEGFSSIREDFSRMKEERIIAYQDLVSTNSPLENDYVLGLTQANGSFSPGSETLTQRFAFDISLRDRPLNKRITKKLESFFESSTTYYHGQEEVVHFKVQKMATLRDKVIPFFSNPENKLGGRKSEQFVFFKDHFNKIKSSKVDGELNA